MSKAEFEAKRVVVTTAVGTGQQGFADASHPLTAKIARANGVAVDHNPNGTAPRHRLVIADTANACIRAVDLLSGAVTTLAGVPGKPGKAQPTPTACDAAHFNAPIDVAVDPLDGSIVVSDHENHCVRRVGADGKVTVIAGSGSAGYKDGVGAAAEFRYPHGLAIDSKGDVYVGDQMNGRVRRIARATGHVTTVAGDGQLKVADHPSNPLSASLFQARRLLLVEAKGLLYVTGKASLRVIDLNNKSVSTVPLSAPISMGHGLCVNPFSDHALEGEGEGESLLVGDGDDKQPALYAVCVSRSAAPKAAATAAKAKAKAATYAYGHVTKVSGDGPGFSDGKAGAVDARWGGVRGFACSRDGRVYVCDAINSRIRVLHREGAAPVVPVAPAPAAGAGAGVGAAAVGAADALKLASAPPLHAAAAAAAAASAAASVSAPPATAGSNHNVQPPPGPA